LSGTAAAGSSAAAATAGFAFVTLRFGFGFSAASAGSAAAGAGAGAGETVGRNALNASSCSSDNLSPVFKRRMAAAIRDDGMEDIFFKIGKKGQKGREREKTRKNP
jgi:hypothetical protein